MIRQFVVDYQSRRMVAGDDKNSVSIVRQTLVFFDEVAETVVGVQHRVETGFVFAVYRCLLRLHLIDSLVCLIRIILLFFIIFDVERLVVGDGYQCVKHWRLHLPDFFDASVKHDMVEVAPPCAEVFVASFILIIEIAHIVDVLCDEVFRDVTPGKVLVMLFISSKTFAMCRLFR